jgi:hypothetical protein
VALPLPATRGEVGLRSNPREGKAHRGIHDHELSRGLGSVRHSWARSSLFCPSGARHLAQASSFGAALILLLSFRGDAKHRARNP